MSGRVAIRELRTPGEFLATMDVSKAAWGFTERSVSPASDLVAATHAGGLTAAAFAGKKMLGFYLDASYWMVSGDNGRMEPLDPVNRDFISYEGNNTTMIMEDGVLGLDLDSNYRSAKLEFGIFGRLTSKFEDDFKMMFLYSTFVFDKPPDLAGVECDSDIGKEFDFSFMWRIHPRFVASTGYGVVWDAEFFTLEDSFGAEDDNFSVWFLRFTAEF